MDGDGFIMFKQMRRKDRELDKEKSIELLKRSEYGILSTIGESGYCYGIPLNFVYFDNAIYFHCAKEGHKLENIRYNNKVSFTLVGKTEVIPEKFSTKYESVVVFGNAEEIEGDEKEKALIALIEKYSPDFKEAGLEYIKRDKDRTIVIKILIEKVSGKGRN